MALPLDAPRPRSKAPLALVVAAMGVVFGDIGTSPLYSIQTVFSIHGGAVRATSEDVLGVISMVIWSLLLIVTLAYIGFILRADNHGEGGILSLAALIRHKLGKTSHRAGAAVILAIIGASLFYGDSLITPAISVMSAIEGIEVVDPGFAEYIVPLSALILTGLFVAQRWGTGKIGTAFGPVMVMWFLVLLVLGLPKIVENPSVLRALSPTYAIAFALDRPFIAFIALGAVVLAVT
ncbi:MAG: KUP/HAK/KT family potassium transporter, partial [Kocuria sp.]|nr:KUP/HAK/KT family potassium transporter [Kocuria sp.]MDN5655250.1 KUP/HAK/KT family potassium transporter [Kocuria sp.]